MGHFSSGVERGCGFSAYVTRLSNYFIPSVRHGSPTGDLPPDPESSEGVFAPSVFKRLETSASDGLGIVHVRLCSIMFVLGGKCAQPPPLRCYLVPSSRWQGGQTARRAYPKQNTAAA